MYTYIHIHRCTYTYVGDQPFSDPHEFLNSTGLCHPVLYAFHTQFDCKKIKVSGRIIFQTASDQFQALRIVSCKIFNSCNKTNIFIVLWDFRHRLTNVKHFWLLAEKYQIPCIKTNILIRLSIFKQRPTISKHAVLPHEILYSSYQNQYFHWVARFQTASD